MQGDVRDDIRRFDATRLGKTVRTQLFAQLCRLNGWPVPAPRISWGGDNIDDLEVTGDLISALKSAGLRVTDEGVATLSKRMALPLERDPLPGLGQLSALAAPSSGQLPATRSDQARAAVDSLAAKTAPSLADELSRALTPLSGVISSATSISDLESRLLAAVPKLDLRAATTLAESALVSAAVNATLSSRDA